MDTFHDSDVLSSENVEKINDNHIPRVSILEDHAHTLIHTKSASFDSNGHVFKLARLNPEELGEVASQKTTPSSSSNSLDSCTSSLEAESSEMKAIETSAYSRLTDPGGPFQVTHHCCSFSFIRPFATKSHTTCAGI